MFDYHLHTSVSYDGRGTAEEMVRAATAAGLKEICFTDHRDYQHCVPRSQTTFTMEAYRNAYEGLDSAGLTVRHGAEVGLTPWNVEEISKDLQAYPYDFVLGSIHFINDEDPYLPPYWVGRDPLVAERQYFEEMLKCVQLHDNFDVLGHLTYISKCKAHPCPRIIPVDTYREEVTQIMKILIEKGKGIEVNTSGLDRCGDFLPGVDYLKLFRDLGGEIVTVGSDAHAPDRVGQHIDTALDMLRDIFGHVCTFQNRKPVFHKL
ncbi:MAG: histidinol-phosphatase HisJ family protein [Ruminococcaceae bacterium]|nr:histidinol-phosphatase HisJ family protein [Oscillospiraceae bacterium]